MDRCGIWTVARGPGLLHNADKHNRIKKRTSDIETYDPLHLGIFFLRIEEKR